MSDSHHYGLALALCSCFSDLLVHSLLFVLHFPLLLSVFLFFLFPSFSSFAFSFSFLPLLLCFLPPLLSFFLLFFLPESTIRIHSGFLPLRVLASFDYSFAISPSCSSSFFQVVLKSQQSTSLGSIKCFCRKDWYDDDA